MTLMLTFGYYLEDTIKDQKELAEMLALFLFVTFRKRDEKER